MSRTEMSQTRLCYRDLREENFGRVNAYLLASGMWCYWPFRLWYPEVGPDEILGVPQAREPVHPDIPPRTSSDGMVAQGINSKSMPCPHCGAPPSRHVVRQWGVYPGDADHYCGDCGKFVRARNSG